MIKLFNKYEQFLKYVVVAVSSFLIDIILFNIFLLVFSFTKHRIIISTIFARIISSFINYLLNRNKVFNNNEDKAKTIYKYYLLVVIQMFVSAYLVNGLSKVININLNFIKIPVDICIFIANFFIQKLIIFRDKK